MQESMSQGKVIILGSVTRAMGAKDILFARGIRSYLRRIKSSAEFGCGYGLHVPENVDSAIFALRQVGMKILAVTDP